MNFSNLFNVPSPEALEFAQPYLYSVTDGPKHAAIKADLMSTLCNLLKLDKSEYEILYSGSKYQAYKTLIYHIIHTFIIKTNYFRPDIMIFSHDSPEIRHITQAEQQIQRARIIDLDISSADNWDPEIQIRQNLHSNTCFLNLPIVNRDGIQFKLEHIDQICDLAVETNFALCADISHAWSGLQRLNLAKFPIIYCDSTNLNGINWFGVLLIKKQFLDGWELQDVVSGGFAFNAHGYGAALMLRHITAPKNLPIQLRSEFIARLKDCGFKFFTLDIFSGGIGKIDHGIIFVLNPKMPSCANNILAFLIVEGGKCKNSQQIYEKLLEEKILIRVSNMTYLLDVPELENVLIVAMGDHSSQDIENLVKAIL